MKKITVYIIFLLFFTLIGCSQQDLSVTVDQTLHKNYCSGFPVDLKITNQEVSYDMDRKVIKIRATVLNESKMETPYVAIFVKLNYKKNLFQEEAIFFTDGESVSIKKNESKVITMEKEIPTESKTLSSVVLSSYYSLTLEQAKEYFNR